MRRNDHGSEENCSNGTTLILFFKPEDSEYIKKNQKQEERTS